MKKVFLVNLPWRKGERYGIRAGSRWPFTSIVKVGKKIPGYMPFPFFFRICSCGFRKK